MPTLYARHVSDWSFCKRCELCKTRNRVVLARGQIPCEVLLVGEGPGQSEDVLGRPFCGPAGHLLDRIIKESGLLLRRYAITNLVACIPRDEEGQKAGEPTDKCIEACKPRLLEFIRLCKPRVVVAVGRLAQKHLNAEALRVVPITHPAAILRMDVAQRGLAIQRCVVILRDVVEGIDEVPF